MMFDWLPTPNWNLVTLLFGVGLFLATAVFSWIAISRSRFSAGMIFLESIRMLLVTLVAYTINQPERIQTFMPDEDPTLVVLWDNSLSMNTQDVLEDGSVDAKTRLEFVKPLLDEAIWDPFREKVNIVIKDFSSALSLDGQPSSSDENGEQSESEAKAQTEAARRATDLNAALQEVLEGTANLRGVVMFTDGTWNIGDSPTRAATNLRMREVPLYTIAVGDDKAQPDIEILSLDAPTFGVVGKATRIPYTIKSTMARDVDMVASLNSSDGDELTATVRVPANGILREAFTWHPKKTGEYTLSLKVPKQDEERAEANNRKEVPISIKKEALKVLVVESYPRWEYRYLRNALSRDPGVEVKCLLFHPKLAKVGGGEDYIDAFPSADELSEFDVIFLGDVGIGEGGERATYLTEEDCKNIRGLIESQASGLVFMPGFRGNQFSLNQSEDIEKLFPVVLDNSQIRGWGSPVPAQFQLTELGRESLLTKLADTPEVNASVWKGLPGFQWYAPVLRAKAGTQTLAVHSTEQNASGRVPLLVTKTYGKGKVLFMGTDGAWRWRKGVEDKYHYRFWGQVVRWMAYQRNMAEGDSMRLFYSPDRPKVGGTITLNANVMSLSGEPLQDGNVKVQIVTPSAKTVTVSLTPQNSEDQWGLFTEFFTPLEPGEHQVLMTCEENGSTLETTISVQGSEREKLGQPANYELLEELAKITRGKAVKGDEISVVFDAVSELPEPEPETKRFRLWSNPWWASSLIFLLGVFWVGRKFVGKI